jgi:type IV pilus assembly protein PilO
MKLDDFRNIDLNNVGNLPVPVKLVLLVVIFVVLVFLGYWVLWSDQIEEWDQAVAKEQELRDTFLIKKSQAVKIDAYRQQMVDIEKTFGALLKQLPDKSQMDGLLTDINQAGLGRGLEFELFKPGAEVIADLYAEMPIQVKVKGTYHDIGAFATDVSKLSRIVTLNNLNIMPMNKDAKDGLLSMEAVAQTYRYLDSSEVASRNAQKQASKDKK